MVTSPWGEGGAYALYALTVEAFIGHESLRGGGALFHTGAIVDGPASSLLFSASATKVNFYPVDRNSHLIMVHYCAVVNPQHRGEHERRLCFATPCFEIPPNYILPKRFPKFTVKLRFSSLHCYTTVNTRLQSVGSRSFRVM